MSQLSFEQRLNVLEQQVAELKAKQANGPTEKDWRRTVGAYPGMQEIFAEAMKLRKADRRKARKHPKQASRGKP